jgi:hypothetical protein
VALERDAARAEGDMDAKRRRMVAWYDPAQLGRTGLQVATSTLIGRRADYRVIESLSTPVAQPILRQAGDEIGIDFVADVGDGWASTYAVASLLGAPQLTIGKETLPRGEILVMGGDAVYPTPDRDAYEERLVSPYRDALPEVEQGKEPLLVTIPGNHDWYDGLISFTRLFCQGRTLGKWQTEQKRSYFAVKLPQRWWLLGVDIQLESDIDLPQLEYFTSLRLTAGDNILICTPEPDWVYGNIYDPRLQNNLAHLERELESDGAQVRARIAGDLHHYRRHETVANNPQTGTPDQYITCGGGGAFLHSTYVRPPKPQGKKQGVKKEVTLGKDELRLGAPEDEHPEIIVKRKAFPSEKRSVALACWNLLFPVLNPTFGIATAVIYTILGWVLIPECKADMSFGKALEALPRQPGALAWVAIFLMAFVLFTDTHSQWYRWVAGLLHGLVHQGAALALALAGLGLVGAKASFTSRFVAQMTATLVGGYVVGGVLMGLYLLVSLVVFRRHANEAFSGIRSRHWKSFLRMRIDRQGTLTILAIGLRHVPRRGHWVRSKVPGPAWVPKPEVGPLRPEIIDRVVLPASPAAPAGKEPSP